MIRKLSGSAEEIDNKDPVDAEPPPYANHGQKRSFTSAKYDVNGNSDTLDRRKVDKSIELAPPLPNGPVQVAQHNQGPLKRQQLVAPAQDIDRMPEPRNWRLSRTRNPWSCSLLTITMTFLAVTFFLSIMHAFLTRQLDSKGCDMCWSRPIYFKFSDFDTEHTRFASKYHLYLHREGGFDEDPKVGGRTALCSLS